VCVVYPCCVLTHVCFVLFLFSLSTCVCVYLQVQGPLRECHSIRSDDSGIAYYYTPLVCVSDVIRGLPATMVWRHNQSKLKKLMRVDYTQILTNMIGSMCHLRESLSIRARNSTKQKIIMPIEPLIASGPLRASQKTWCMGEDSSICYIWITCMLFKDTRHTYVWSNSITCTSCLKTYICCWTFMLYKPYMLNNKIYCWI